MKQTNQLKHKEGKNNRNMNNTQISGTGEAHQLNSATGKRPTRMKCKLYRSNIDQMWTPAGTRAIEWEQEPLLYKDHTPTIQL